METIKLRVRRQQLKLIGIVRRVCDQAGIKLIAVKETALIVQNPALESKWSDNIEFAIKYEDRIKFKEFFSKMATINCLYEDPYSNWKAPNFCTKIYLKDKEINFKEYEKNTYSRRYVSIDIHWLISVNEERYNKKIKYLKMLHAMRQLYQRKITTYYRVKDRSIFVKILWTLSWIFIKGYHKIFLIFSGNPKSNSRGFKNIMIALSKDADGYILSGDFEKYGYWKKEYFDNLVVKNFYDQALYVSAKNKDLTEKFSSTYLSGPKYNMKYSAMYPVKNN